ncbi:hypothetical protein FRB95_008982 [Tulasnella sp. JGI-2019a]|nr:hypothetical protein FRB93_007040 [Tulasnella sp. JGI-2019a]KAG9026337.1 hypothetical protein FRB95_008982 [Tulasnella sp. JGI-2019a]
MDAQQQQAVSDVFADDKQKGAVVRTIDTSKTPEQNIAAMAKDIAPLQPIHKLPGSYTTQTFATAPTITISEALEPKEITPVNSNGNPQPQTDTNLISPEATPEPAQDAQATPDVTDAVPGALPAAPARGIPPWFKAGWRAVSGIDDPPLSGEAVDKLAINQWLSDMYYGQWYHHAGVIVFAVVTTHLMTLLRMGWGWLFILLAVCATYHTTSAARFRRNARNDIQRELVKKRLTSEHESADWMNNFLDRFWLIYEPHLSKSIMGTVDQILSVSAPSFLDSIRLSTFTLGTTAPRIDKVRTFPGTADDIVEMDWSLKFTPTDRTDITPRQAERKVNPKITLDVKVGKGPASVPLPILLEDISFEGLMRIRMKLMSAFPHIQLVELSFLEKPTFDYVLKPLGGDTFGWDVGNIPGLSSFIRDTVHSILGPMMYDPQYFTLNLEQLLSGTPLDTAIGVVQIRIVAAKNLRGAKVGGGTPDPYISMAISNRAELARTGHKPSTTNPHWGSTHYIIVTSMNMTESLSLTAFDHNDHRKDTELGATIFDLHTLTENATQERVIKDILKDGKERGQLEFDISFFPVIHPAVIDGVPEPIPESNVGICRLVIHQAKELDKKGSLSNDLNPLAKVFLGNSKTPQYTTPTYKHTLAPVWEGATEFLVSNKKHSVINVKIIDDRDFMKDPVIGTFTASLEKILDATAKTGLETWFNLNKCRTGKLRMTAEWKPLSMAGNLQGAGTYSPPIGVLRLWIKNAKDVKNVESGLGGKSDPYVRVTLHGIIKARTDVVPNNLSPVWDQIIYVPVHSLREALILEVMDYQNLGKDRPLGTVELSVGSLAAENASNREYPYQGTGRHAFSSPIHIDKLITKGFLEYEAEFIPSLNLKGLDFDDKNEVEKALEEDNAESGMSASRTSSDADYEKVSPVDASEPPAPSEQPTHTRGARSVDTVGTIGTVQSVMSTSTAATVGIEKGVVQLSKEQLLQSSSGIIIFHVKTGELAKKSRLEILLDEGYWPAFATEKAISTQAKWESVGEGFVKELEFGRVWLRLNEHDDGEKENIVGDFKCDTKAFLETCLNHDEEFTLTSDQERFAGKVIISAKYVPVDIKLEPRESILDMGVVRVELLDGKELPAADRSGKSDPFVVFTLNDTRVHKSQTIKKTLAPTWNETFTVMVPSRVTSAFSVEVFDWNQIEQAKSLGEGDIDLAAIDPFTTKEIVVPLSLPSAGPKGSIRVRLLFHPEIIAKSRKSTSTFGTAGRAMSSVASAPLGAGKGVLHGVGAVGKVGKGLFSRPKPIEEDNEPVSEPPSTQLSVPVAGRELPATSADASATLPVASSTALAVADEMGPPPEGGSIRVTVIGAKDVSMAGESSIKPYLVLRAGNGKEEFKTKHAGKTQAPQWNETFAVPVTNETRVLLATIYDHKTLGKDKTLGEAEIDIWRHIRPNGLNPLPAADVWVELRQGAGQLNLRLEFDRNGGASNGTARSVSSTFSGATSARAGLSSPSRFSINKRTADE